MILVIQALTPRQGYHLVRDFMQLFAKGFQPVLANINKNKNSTRTNNLFQTMI